MYIGWVGLLAHLKWKWPEKQGERSRLPQEEGLVTSSGKFQEEKSQFGEGASGTPLSFCTTGGSLVTLWQDGVEKVVSMFCTETHT